MAQIVAIDITGDGRLKCRRCSIISPAFYPNCPDCGSETFVALQVEPHPPVVLPDGFFGNVLDSTADYVQLLIYEKRAKELVNSFERKGYLLFVERKVIVSINNKFGFSCSEVSCYLARDAVRDRFVSSDRTFMLVPWLGGASPNATSYTISCPDGVIPTKVANSRPHKPPLIPPVASILESNNIPPVGVQLFCSICKSPNDDVSEDETDEDEMDDEDFYYDDFGVGDRRSFRVLRPCSHVFHKTCVDKWFKSGRLDCPQCRYVVPTDDEDLNFWASLHNPRL